MLKRWWQFWRPKSKTRTLFERYPDPDEDGEGKWVWSEAGSGGWLWLPDMLEQEERCQSELCLFGREWIQCKKRRGHRGPHRDSETWGWDKGDERA